MPSASGPSARGDVQSAKLPVAVPGPSSWHSNVAPASVAEKVNAGEESPVAPLGPVLIVVSGAVASTVKVRVTGVWSVLPAASVARTEKVCSPSASVASVRGVVHGSNAPASIRHSNVEPGSLAKNVNCGVVWRVVPLGPSSIAVFGAAVSTVNDRLAGVGSVSPAASVARTVKVCVPSASVASVRGDVHDPKASLSTRHSNVVLASLEENVNVGVAMLIAPLGPLSITVSGAAVSTVNVRVAGVGSVLPAISVARTENVCSPSGSAPSVSGDVHVANAPLSMRHSKVEFGSLDENVYGLDVDVIDVSRRRRVDRESASRRRLIRVPGRVRRADRERVLTVSQGAERKRRGARRRTRPCRACTRTSNWPRSTRTCTGSTST